MPAEIDYGTSDTDAEGHAVQPVVSQQGWTAWEYSGLLAELVFIM